MLHGVMYVSGSIPVLAAAAAWWSHYSRGMLNRLRRIKVRRRTTCAAAAGPVKRARSTPDQEDDICPYKHTCCWWWSPIYTVFKLSLLITEFLILCEKYIKIL